MSGNLKPLRDRSVLTVSALIKSMRGSLLNVFHHMSELSILDGKIPTHVAFSGKGMPEGIQSYDRIRARLTRSYIEEADAITLAHVSIPKKSADAKLDYDISVGLDIKRRIYTVSVSFDDRMPKTADYLRLLTKFPKMFVLSYGYGFCSRRNEGPLFHVIGLPFGVSPVPEDDDEHDSDMGWHWHDLISSTTQLPKRSHALRSVYPWQLLTERHFELLVGRTKLNNWILQKPVRGELKELGGGCWSWTVPGSSIEQIRLDLYSSGLLWAWWPLGEDQPKAQRGR